jgi:UDP-N-acetylglucosamine 2-epimerase (non-hydrolysing)
MHLLHVLGARPNFMKAAPVIAACHARGMTQTVVHTGQHYDYNMSQVFFEQLGLPIPDFNLDVGSGSHAEQTAQVMLRLEPILTSISPDWVVVYGDVNSTLAAALVSAKLPLPIAHVEAGLRSFDWSMPEEINRLLTDQLADLLFTPSEDGNANLLREGIPASRIQPVGNIMIDTLVKSLPLTDQIDLRRYPHRYALVTLHRPSNVDDLDRLRKILEALVSINDRVPVIFPIHPRTRRRIAALNLIDNASNLQLIEPLSYLEFLALERRATVVITDSGGIQEETTFLGIPCLTLRENTERPITLTLGTNQLIGSDYAHLQREVDAILAGRAKPGQIPPLWDGHTADRIVAVLIERSPYRASVG